MIFENKNVIIFVDLAIFRKMVSIFFKLTFALVTGRVSKIFILTFVPILDIQCQLLAISMFSN